jgi:hypothetical protein
MMATALSILALALFARQRFLETRSCRPLCQYWQSTKQSLVAFPLAMGLWLLLRDRRWLIPYVAVLLVCGLPPAWWLQKATGGLFWLNIVTMNRLGYHLFQIVPVMIHHAGPLFLLLGLAGVLMWRRFRAGQADFMDFYLAVVGGLTVISCGRDGAHVQYVIELCAAALLFLLRVTGLPAMPGRDRLVAAQLLLLVVYAPPHVLLEHGPFALDTRQASAKVLPVIREHPGPMISQAGHLALLGTGQIYIQLGHFMNLARTDMWDQQRIITDVTARKLEWVVTLFDMDGETLSADDRERFTPELLAELRENYRLLMREGPYYLYRPVAGR